MNNILFNKKGYALMLTIISLAVVSLLGTALFSIIISEIKMNNAIEHTTIARYLAEAGMEHGLELLGEYDWKEGKSWDETNILLNELNRVYEYRVQVTLEYIEGEVDKSIKVSIISTGTASIKGKVREHTLSRKADF